MAPHWSPRRHGRPTARTHRKRCSPPHNRFHPWRDNKVRAINRASTIGHPALIDTSRFMINVLLQTLKAKPPAGSPPPEETEGLRGLRRETPKVAPGTCPVHCVAMSGAAEETGGFRGREARPTAKRSGAGGLRSLSRTLRSNVGSCEVKRRKAVHEAPERDRQGSRRAEQDKGRRRRASARSRRRN